MNAEIFIKKSLLILGSVNKYESINTSDCLSMWVNHNFTPFASLRTVRPTVATHPFSLTLGAPKFSETPEVLQLHPYAFFLKIYVD